MSDKDDVLAGLEELEILESFHQKLLSGMVEMPPEFNKVLMDNFEDLLA